MDGSQLSSRRLYGLDRGQSGDFGISAPAAFAPDLVLDAEAFLAMPWMKVRGGGPPGPGFGAKGGKGFEVGGSTQGLQGEPPFVFLRVS